MIYLYFVLSEEVRKFNDRYGLTKLSKIRFYGDHKKEQLEKYKNTNMRPKKSQFAMSILRNELPKLLNVNYMLECLSNPNLSTQLSSSGMFASSILPLQSSGNPLMNRANSASMAITASNHSLSSNRSRIATTKNREKKSLIFGKVK